MAELPRVLNKKSFEWNATSRPIPVGTLCNETDTGRTKIGNGATWANTPYVQKTSILQKTHRNENARYFLPTINELHKACRYDPNKGGAGVPGYWRYGTKSDDIPGIATIDEFGVGQMTDADNTANWGGASSWSGIERSLASVGTCGAPSHYGVYDVDGNSFDLAEDAGGNPVAPGGGPDSWRFILHGGSTHTNPIAWDQNYSSHYLMPYTAMTLRYYVYGIRVASITNPDNISRFVDVGDAGNAADSNGQNVVKLNGYGAVDYDYKIRAVHVTNAEFVEFLNAIAAEDEYAVFAADDYYASAGDLGPQSGSYGGIKRHGKKGSYWYEVMDNWHDKPATHNNWVAQARYCNWLHNGKPVGPQIAATTEDGAYTLNGETGNSVARNYA